MLLLPERIAVVDKHNKFLSYSHPARVRKLLKDGKAEIFSTDPFAVRLKGERGKIMTPHVTNFTDFFKGEERDIYVMNVGGTQISFDIEVSPGRVVPILIPKTRHPYNLTQHVPFAALKSSPDIRKLANRRPPVLRLLTYEEYTAYYADLAKRYGTTVESEVEKALELQAGLLNKKAYTVNEDERAKTIDALREEREADPAAMVEAQPLPKVVGLCAQVGPDVDKEHKLEARAFIEELEILAPDMKPIDFEYVYSHGHWKSVKTWVNQHQGATTGKVSEGSE